MNKTHPPQTLPLPDMPEAPQALKKRGRPATGQAKSAAERKREQRERERGQIGQALSSADLTMSAVTTTTLCDELAKAINGGYRQIARDLLAELTERANKL